MRILLVDDEAGVLQALAAFFRTLPGHEWRVAANAQKALEQAAALGGCDLLITDVVMEPTDGFTLRDELLARYPEMKVAFISGYDLSDHAEQLGSAVLMPKPLDLEALGAFVESCIPAPAPVPQAVPRAVPAGPRAINAGVPSAPPRAVPVPAGGPRAVAQPNGAPQPTAAPRPTAVPMPQAVPTPQAVPQARAVPTPQAVPVAQPVPVAQAVPQAVAQAPAPQPMAQPASMPAPASARGPGLAPVASGVRPHPGPSSDPLIGVQLGDYRVQKFLGKGHWGAVYLAIQLSVNRPVGLKVLDSEQAENEEARAHFLADARAKAAVQHPFIVSVFEADERNGLVFYTQEYLDGETLGYLITTGHQLDEKTVLHVMKVAGEGLNYLWSNNISHGAFGPESIRIGQDGLPRLTNLATATPDNTVSVQAEIQMLGHLIGQLLPTAATSPGLRAFLGRTSGGPNAVTTWPVLLQAVKALEPKVIPVEAAKIKAADDAAMRAVEAARRAQKRSMIFSICSLVALAATVTFVVWKLLVSNRRNILDQVQIPAGKYLVGDPGTGTKEADLGAFEIDNFEVTIGQYAEFLEWIKKNPTDEHKFDHPNSNQRHITHLTKEADLLIRIAGNRNGRAFKDATRNEPGVAVDLNCPMVGVTWWQAYAYAHWKGNGTGENRDLPTEEEWEAAARGQKGFKYPWGDELKLDRFNSNEGYQPLQPGGFVPKDGYNYWSPVDEFSKDKSEFGVYGMQGNVAEWVYRKDQQKREFPVVKGSSFATPPAELFQRMTTVLAEDCWFVFPQKSKPQPGTPAAAQTIGQIFVGDEITAATRTLYIGFRTVKRK